MKNITNKAENNGFMMSKDFEELQEKKSQRRESWASCYPVKKDFFAAFVCFGGRKI
jgi:hypothetical protein